MSDSDIDDLLGKPPRKKIGRPPKTAAQKQATVTARKARTVGRKTGMHTRSDAAPKHATGQRGPLDIGENPQPGDMVPRFERFWRPVNVQFLLDVYRLANSKEVHKKLAECTPVAWDDKGFPQYDFIEASSYLIKPRGGDLVALIRNMKSSDLPPALMPAVWKAKLDEQTWNTRAGNLWRTEDVLDMFGEIFLLMKSTMQLWVETLNDRGDLSAEQWEAMNQMVYGLQTELHEKLVELPKKRRTGPSNVENDASAPITDTSDIEDLL